MKILLLLLAVVFLGAGCRKYTNEIKGKSGIYIGDSEICLNEKCDTFSNLLPPELTLVPRKEALKLCSEIAKGWCAEETGTATATLQGYFENSLRVRTF